MFDIQMQVWEDMKKVENNTIWVATTQYTKEQERSMCEIVKVFTGSYPVYGSGDLKQEYYPD
ncbi:MAG: hypothetical protein IJ646_13330 [Clostridia bacterium]|nr:hypothetical protein [Clostridia bacterium]